MPTCRNVLIGGFLRNFAGCIVTYYLPVFHSKNFPANKALYASINAMILSLCGLFASVSSGIMADVFEKKTLWAKALICMILQSISVPLMCLTCSSPGGDHASSGELRRAQASSGELRRDQARSRAVCSSPA